METLQRQLTQLNQLPGNSLEPKLAALDAVLRPLHVEPSGAPTNPTALPEPTTAAPTTPTAIPTPDPNQAVGEVTY